MSENNLYDSLRDIIPQVCSIVKDPNVKNGFAVVGIDSKGQPIEDTRSGMSVSLENDIITIFNWQDGCWGRIAMRMPFSHFTRLLGEGSTTTCGDPVMEQYPGMNEGIMRVKS